jgi:hypothetical protein
MLLRHNMRRAPLFLALFLFASAAQADTVAAVPPNPVAGAPFVIHAFAFCASIGDATVNGTNIDIVATSLGSCCGECGTQRDVPVGPLPAGTYTIRLISSFNSAVLATATVMVVPDVPALDLRLLALLAAAIVVIGMVRLGAG